MATNEPVITTQAELCATWEQLMGPHGFGDRSLWLMLIGPDGVPLRQLTEIEQLPPQPDGELVGNLIRLCEQLAADGLRVALLLSRPGRDGLSAADRAWARELHTAARRSGLTMLPLHRANDAGVLPVTPDDLTFPGAA